MRHLLGFGLETARQSKAEFAELTAVEFKQKFIRIKNGVTISHTSSTSGYAARVLVAGRWGFASCPAGGKAAMNTLVASALAAAEFTPRPLHPVSFGSCLPVRDQWQTPWKIDPFALAHGELLDMLREADAGMAIPGIDGRVTEVNFRREHRLYCNSEGTELDQTIINSGGGVWAWVLADDELIQRSWPSPGGSYAGQGYEYIQMLDLPANARRIAREAVALLTAPPCPEGVGDVILNGSMLAAQLHYTCGLRAQLGNAGAVPPETAGSARMGSPILTISGDAAWPGGAGSYGYDWEGVKAQKVDIVREGKFTEYFSGREQAAAIGRSSTGAMRSSSWRNPPSPRMTNLVVQPGSGTLKTLLAGIERGILLDSYSAFAVSPNVQEFVARAEAGWLIELGQIRHMVRSPVYKGYPAAFWSGCDAIACPEERQVLGLMDAGITVGHIVVPVRIRGVKVGACL